MSQAGVRPPKKLIEHHLGADNFGTGRFIIEFVPQNPAAIIRHNTVYVVYSSFYSCTEPAFFLAVYKSCSVSKVATEQDHCKPVVAAIGEKLVGITVELLDEAADVQFLIIGHLLIF